MSNGVTSSKTTDRSIIQKGYNLSDFNKDLAIFTNLSTTHTQKDPNHHWDMFKAEVNRLSTLHIPTRQIKSRPHQPRNSQTQKKKRPTVHKTGKVMFTEKSLH